MISHLFKQGRSRDIVGLDMSPDFIKLLKINSLDTPPIIEHFALSSFEKQIIFKGEIKEPTLLISALKSLFTTVSCKKIALAVPRSAVIIKNTLIDKRLTEKEIESRAWVEAERHFPELVGNIYLDFQIIGPDEKDPSQLDLMLIACRKTQIDPFLQVLIAAGLTPEIIDISTHALNRALTMISAPDETVGLLNLDYSLSTFIVSHQKKLVYDHDHSYDGRRLMTQATEYFNNKDAEANAYQDILRERLSTHLRHTMHIFLSSRPNVKLQKLFISGECANLPNLPEYIQQEVNIATALANPFADMQKDKSINAEKLTKTTPLMMLSCGLALSQLYV